MSDAYPRCEFPVREASARDIQAMASHHRKMFEELWEGTGQRLEPLRAADLEKVYARKLEGELASGSCRGWIIEDRGEVVAGGAISLVSLVPTPVDPSPKVAYLHSVYTEKSHRGKGCAQKIVASILDFCGAHGVRRVMLNASEAGRPIYARLGFGPVDDMMRLILPLTRDRGKVGQGSGDCRNGCGRDPGINE